MTNEHKNPIERASDPLVGSGAPSNEADSSGMTEANIRTSNNPEMQHPDVGQGMGTAAGGK